MTQSFFQRRETPTRQTPRQNAHLTFRGNVKYGRHGWLRLTPAYSLHVVTEILDSACPDDFVLDPFSGTGTTPLASSVLGIRAHSVDLNPFLVWLGNLKLKQFPHHASNDLIILANEVLQALRKPLKPSAGWIPPLHQIEKWWDPPVLFTLAALYELIHETHKTNPISTDLLKIAFCKVAIETSHASFGHQSMSFKKRPVEPQPFLLDEMSLTDPQARIGSLFLEYVAEIAEGLRSEKPSAKAHVYLGDSRDLESALPDRGYTKVITSPPYPNRMSYIRELRPYMYWLGYLKNGRQAGEMDWQAIGGTWGCATSNLGTWAPDPAISIPYPNLSQMIASIANQHPLLARYVHKYFEDMHRHIFSLRKVMASGGACHYVIGNSKFYATLLPAEEIYASLFREAGFREVQTRVLRKRNSKKELYEYIVSARAP